MAEGLSCARCGREVWAGANQFPGEGRICVTCYTRALETHGTCAGCGAERLTPGRTPAGEPLCTRCAGLTNVTCERCGREGRRYPRGTCGNCVLTGRLADLIDDGSGRPRRELLPLLEAVGGMQRPWVGITWVGRSHIQRFLRGLATGEVPLTHGGLSQLGSARAIAYLRDLLMQHGVLPERDRHLLMLES